MVKKKKIIMTILFQILGETTKLLMRSDKNKLLHAIKSVLEKANDTIENGGIMYRDLPPEVAEKEIRTLDNIYSALDKIFDLILDDMEQSQKDIILSDYNRLVDNLENIREGLELYTNIEAMQAISEIARGDYSNFIRVA